MDAPLIFPGLGPCLSSVLHSLLKFRFHAYAVHMRYFSSLCQAGDRTMCARYEHGFAASRSVRVGPREGSLITSMRVD